MKPDASPNLESDAASPTQPVNSNHLAEATRKALQALPAKHRGSIFKKANPDSPALHNLLKAAHIPPSFKPGRIANWLPPDQQRKLEELVLTPDREARFQSLLQYFFCAAHPSLNNLLLELTVPKIRQALSDH